jgi:hypothetical protein
MSKKTLAVIKARRKTPPPVGVPAAAPARPLDSDETETKAAKLTNPHAVGADRLPKLKAHLSAAQQRAALKKNAAQKRRSSK